VDDASPRPAQVTSVAIPIADLPIDPKTPLFRVRNKKETRYCYSEKERDVAAEEIKGHEITRFKGLGEISPSEFGQFIGPDIRLVPVALSSIGEASQSLEFCMGKNTPARREYIIDNLLPDVS